MIMSMKTVYRVNQKTFVIMFMLQKYKLVVIIIFVIVVKVYIIKYMVMNETSVRSKTKKLLNAIIDVLC